MSIHVDDFDCVNCLHSFKTKTSKLESHKKGWGKRYFCDVVMSS